MIYQPQTPQTPRRWSWHGFLQDWLKPLLYVVVIVLLLNLFFPRYYVEGRSMEPNFSESDRLFTATLEVWTAAIQRGQVVVLASPVDGLLVLKRVIGLPGEKVEVRAGSVYIDGVLLQEEYIRQRPTYSGVWHLGPDEYFVLGDNRNHSYDSADYGPVARENLRAVVRLRFWPLDTLNFFGTP
ncbi:MAG: signal peptidase I [Chloroflexi bacterium]|nr:signal peptidase I [Chloroflexota bacterium]